MARTNKEFGAFVKKAKKNYKESEQAFDAMFGGEQIPAGKYKVKLASADIQKSKGSGRWQIFAQWTITSGAVKGVSVPEWIGLEGEKSFIFLRKWFDNLGYEAPEDLGDIPETLKAVLKEGAEYEIEVSFPDGEYPRIKFLASDEEEEEDGEEEDGEESESEEDEDDDEEESESDDEEDEDEEEDDESEDDDEDGDEDEEEGDEDEEDEEDGEDEDEEDEEEEDDADEENLKALKAFCAGQDIKVSKKDDVDSLIEKISEYDYKDYGKDAVTKDEIELLKKNGLGDHVKKKLKSTDKKSKGKNKKKKKKK